MNFTIEIKRTGKQFQLMFEGSLQLLDLADYLLDIQEIESANVGIFSQVKQYYTEKTTEQLSDIGTGEEDTYIIVEGDQKDQYKQQFAPNQRITGNNNRYQTPEQPLKTQKIYLIGQVQGELNESASMVIGDLVKKIQNMFQIQIFQLIMSKNGVSQDLNSQQFFMQTIQQVGFNNGQSLQVIQAQQGQQQQQQQRQYYTQQQNQFPQQYQQNQFGQQNQYGQQNQQIQSNPPFQNNQQFQQPSSTNTQLNINILDGAIERTLNLPVNLNTTTVQQIQQGVQLYLALDPLYASVEIFLNEFCYNGQTKLSKFLSELGVNSNTKVSAKIRYIGGCDSLI